MRRSFLARIRRVRPELLDQEHETLVLAASLIHDVGHGPFSHSFESITGDRHEARTLEIILDESTEIHQCLTLRAYGELPGKIALFFDESNEDDRIKAAEFPVILDARSSPASSMPIGLITCSETAMPPGADYGQFDWKWLIHHLDLDHDKGRFYLNRKALAGGRTLCFRPDITCIAPSTFTRRAVRPR